MVHALGGLSSSLVPLTRIRARNKVTAKTAKVEGFRVGLRQFTVPDEVIPFAESDLRADDTPQNGTDPAHSLFRSGHEEALIPLESNGNPEAVPLRILPLLVRGGVDNVLLPHRVACVVTPSSLSSIQGDCPCVVVPSGINASWTLGPGTD